MRTPIRILATFAAMLAVSGVAQPAQAQAMTSAQAKEILNELKSIRQLLERQPQGYPAYPQPMYQAPGYPQGYPPPGYPPGAYPPPQYQQPGPQAAPQRPVDDKVNIAFTGGGYSLGKSDAPIVLVEYTDYQCPFCRQFHLNAFDQIKKDWIDTGKLRFVSRDFPLGFHENARAAAIAARCAGEQGKYWELRHVMIQNADKLQADRIASYAADLKLDTAKFQACTSSDVHKAAIDKDMAEATAAGVNGTPSFVVGRLQNDKLTGIRIVGAMPYAEVDSKLKDFMKTIN